MFKLLLLWLAVTPEHDLFFLFVPPPDCTIAVSIHAHAQVARQPHSLRARRTRISSMAANEDEAVPPPRPSLLGPYWRLLRGNRDYALLFAANVVVEMGNWYGPGRPLVRAPGAHQGCGAQVQLCRYAQRAQRSHRCVHPHRHLLLGARAVVPPLVDEAVLPLICGEGTLHSWCRRCLHWC
jgi:hypothetical protein